MMNTTLAQLRELRLEGLATGLQEQLGQAGVAAMSFEERLALLGDREVHWRNDKRQARLLKLVRLKYPQAAIEDIDSRAGGGIQRSAVMSLALGEWVQSGHAVLITGPTGAGKSWLAGRSRADLLEIIDDRASNRATIITSQLPIEHWHEWIGGPTMADAMLDRFMQNHHRFTITGKSLRKKPATGKAKTGDSLELAEN